MLERMFGKSTEKIMRSMLVGDVKVTLCGYGAAECHSGPLRPRFHPKRARALCGVVHQLSRLKDAERRRWVVAAMQLVTDRPVKCPPITKQIDFTDGFLSEKEAIVQENELTKRPFQFNEMLHSLRETELLKLPKGKVFLSAGCSGRWYFDWIESTCKPATHIGVELYSLKPNDLPPNCEWIASSISKFPQVADQSIDIVFSGQNFEHLWPADIVGFLREAHRVLRPGGILAIDTPNRTVTAAIGWVHPEHTAEFTVPELHEMLELAGFTVDSTIGHWLSGKVEGDEVLPLLPDDSRAIEVAVAERVSRATFAPSNAFSIWVNATRDGLPRAEAMADRVTSLWTAANAERAQRTTISANCEQTGDIVSTEGQVSGFLIWGPYIPLVAGHYRVTWRLRLDAPTSGKIGRIDVVDHARNSVKVANDFDAHDLKTGEWVDLSLTFEIPETTFGLEFRLNVKPETALSARRYATIAPM